MEKELIEKLQRIENKLDEQKKKDNWDKLNILTPILIPLSIALVGWFFTSNYNNIQNEIQTSSNTSQEKVALLNAKVGQSQLISDLIDDLSSKNELVRMIATEAILYAAPSPGIKIVETVAKFGNVKDSTFALGALATKRKFLVNNMFSNNITSRNEAINEIITLWRDDEKMVSKLIEKASTCLKQNIDYSVCDTSIYNSIVVLANFTKQPLDIHRKEIKELINNRSIPPKNRVIVTRSYKLLKDF